MIKVNHLNKFFNKGKNNQIHVLNDVSLTLPEKGLVVILGASGSGKTTLLNVIGGLDKVESGQIDFLGKDLSKYHSNEWDDQRNAHVGYIFQNYHLQPALSVYDNVAFVLNMLGITNKEEVDKRVSYILNQMGMFAYRRKKALQLSGGQQQRVAIARALVKNPSIVIADEPTGNLDNKNTTEIMNIISKISQTRLVVMVTHEKEIANFYADRVIEVKDGQIVNDYENDKTLDHGLEVDEAIYLKDLNEVSALDSDYFETKLYATEANPKVKATFIVKNNTLYIDVDSPFKNIILTKENHVVVKDEHFVKKTKAVLSQTSFDLDILDTKDIVKEHKKVVSTKRSLKYAFYKVLSFGRKGKLMLASFVFAGMMIAFSISLLFQALIVKPELTYDREAVRIFSSYSPVQSVTFGETSINYDSVKALDNNFSFYVQTRISLKVNTNLEGVNNQSFSGVLKTTKELSKRDIYKKVKELDELGNADIYVSQGYLNMLLNSSDEQIFGQSVSGNDYGIWNLDQALAETYDLLAGEFVLTNVKIVGIVKDDSKSIYISESLFENYYKNLGYQNEKEYFNDQNNLIVVTQDKSQLLALSDTRIDKTDLYEQAYEENKLLKEEVSKVVLPIGILFMAFTFVGFYFVLRSSLIARVSEVSIYRALGVKKKEVFAMFAIEIFILTCISTLVGYIIGTLGIRQLQKSLLSTLGLVDVTITSFFVGLIIIYGINLLAGLLPVWGLVRKTPAQILSQYDI